MHSSSLLAASVLDALPHLAGMLMVMIVLAILWGVCALVALGVRALQPEDSATMVPVTPTAATTGSEPASASPAAGPVGQPPELVAVIAAAVASTVGRSHRVVSIRPAGSEWEKAGRQSVLSSHRIR